MARIRSFRPSFFLNEELAECNAYGRLLFIGLWCLADREGRLKDKPKRIKAEIFPYDEQDVDLLLEQLAQRGFIVRYGALDEETGKIARYIEIPKFKEHQTPHPREVASRIPARICAAGGKELSNSMPGSGPGRAQVGPRQRPALQHTDPDPDPAAACRAAVPAAAVAAPALLEELQQRGISQARCQEETSGLAEGCIHKAIRDFDRRLSDRRQPVDNPPGLLVKILREHRGCSGEHLSTRQAAIKRRRESERRRLDAIAPNRSKPVVDELTLRFEVPKANGVDHEHN